MEGRNPVWPEPKVFGVMVVIPRTAALFQFVGKRDLKMVICRLCTFRSSAEFDMNFDWRVQGRPRGPHENLVGSAPMPKFAFMICLHSNEQQIDASNVFNFFKRRNQGGKDGHGRCWEALSFARAGRVTFGFASSISGRPGRKAQIPADHLGEKPLLFDVTRHWSRKYFDRQLTCYTRAMEPVLEFFFRRGIELGCCRSCSNWLATISGPRISRTDEQMLLVNFNAPSSAILKTVPQRLTSVDQIAWNQTVSRDARPD